MVIITPQLERNRKKNGGLRQEGGRKWSQEGLYLKRLIYKE